MRTEGQDRHDDRLLIILTDLIYDQLDGDSVLLIFNFKFALLKIAGLNISIMKNTYNYN